ncbi:hypothetical protein EJD97_018088 [Solanum chilense]|uniref:Uncharacterized protein n=1 Tax=Solanum chilense TaxID=4083 RepID=A0A6N2B480_SOLCI|nr:hypothetical protein EJD97_018088 [Solanum chilense]
MVGDEHAGAISLIGCEGQGEGSDNLDLKAKFPRQSNFRGNEVSNGDVQRPLMVVDCSLPSIKFSLPSNPLLSPPFL